THTVAGVEARAALTDEDLAGADDLATEALHTEALGVGVATVLGAGSTLLTCHGSVLRSYRRERSDVDCSDLDLGVPLAVTLALLVTGLVLVLLDDDLGTLGGAQDLDGHGGLVQSGGGDG